MAATHKAPTTDTIKMILLGSIIAAAVIALILTYLHSTAESGTIQSGPIKHITAGARDRNRSSQMGTMH